MRLYISLPPNQFDRLTALARAERRRPQDQAAVLIERALAVQRPPIGDGYNSAIALERGAGQESDDAGNERG
jgi:hypothetical protein